MGESFGKERIRRGRKVCVPREGGSLIRSTLSNLPIYYLYILTIPVSVAQQIEAMQNRFLWGDTEEKKKYHLWLGRR